MQLREPVEHRCPETNDCADLPYGATRSDDVYHFDQMKVTVELQLVLNPDFL